MLRRETKPDFRVLVSFEKGFYAYQGALAAAIRILRPDAEVMTAEPEQIGGAARRFGPDLVITSRSEEANTGGVAAWVQLSLDPSRASRVRVEENHSEMLNPTLDRLLGIVDEVAKSG